MRRNCSASFCPTPSVSCLPLSLLPLARLFSLVASPLTVSSTCRLSPLSRNLSPYFCNCDAPAVSFDSRPHVEWTREYGNIANQTVRAKCAGHRFAFCVGFREFERPALRPMYLFATLSTCKLAKRQTME